MTNLKCQELCIFTQKLGREETRALVQSMESGVEKVMLSEKVTLDISELVEYSCEGSCKRVRLRGDTSKRYRETLRPWTWIPERNWRIEPEDKNWFSICHKKS